MKTPQSSTVTVESVPNPPLITTIPTCRTILATVVWVKPSMEPLAILNYETGEIMPWLALGSSSNDSLDVWTLHLREGAEWSDGEAVDADDVVFTFEMLLNPENAGLWRAPNVQTWLESVETIDAQTVQFNLKTPNPRFGLDFLTLKLGFNILIMPEHIWAGRRSLHLQELPARWFRSLHADQRRRDHLGLRPQRRLVGRRDRRLEDA